MYGCVCVVCGEGGDVSVWGCVTFDKPMQSLNSKVLISSIKEGKTTTFFKPWDKEIN